MLGYLRSGNKRTKLIWWFLTIVTVLTFLVGFSLFGGMGDPTTRARMSGDVGSVNGQNISLSEWQASLEEQRMNYRSRFGSEPMDQDQRIVERDAWRALVNVKMFAREAKKAGLKATDSDVIIGMRTNPPAILLGSQMFQTEGKFDPAKYMQALANPANNWAPYEEIVRSSVPVRKLQERLLSAIKLTEPELQQTYRDRYDRVSATLLVVPPADTGRSPGDEASLQKVYDAYRQRMASGARTQLEVMAIAVTYSEDEIKAAMDLARSLYERAQRGEDFGQLARDYSEGPNAERGGVIDRWLGPNELGPMAGAAIQVKKPGELVEPLREGGRVMLFKIMDPAQDTSSTKTPQPYPGAVKLSQIVVRVRPSAESMRDQRAAAEAMAKEARKEGLSKAATKKGQSTFKTGLYDLSNSPPQLLAVPQVADWGLSAKQGAVSPVFEGGDAFVVAQVTLQHEAGPPSREEVGEQLRMVADAEHRVDLAKPRCDSVVTAIKAGQSLEDAARSVRLAASPIQTTRLQPDPRIAGSPELLGMLLGAPIGKIVGPVRTSQGWLFARKDGAYTSPDSLLNAQLKGQLTNEVLGSRQRRFFDSYIERLRSQSEITDARSGGM